LSLNLILFGAPGSGKGTQAKILEQAYNITHISTGDLLRKRVAVGDDFSREINEKIKIDGGPESDRLMAKMVEERISQTDCINGYILDGFPRTLGQAEALEDMLVKNKKSLTAAIALTVDETTLVERIIGRYSCDNCGASYHDKFSPTMRENCCDLCDSKQLSRRSYDTAAETVNRLHDYRVMTAPVLPYYAAKGIMQSVNSMQDASHVAASIQAILAPKPQS